MRKAKPFPIPVRAKYSCLKCPGYCCSYPEIEVTPRDIERLGRHFGLEYRVAEERFTKYDPVEKVRLLRHRKDHVFDSTCMLFDQEKRRCTVYESRPAVCREYPDSPRCGYTSSSSSSAPTRTTRTSSPSLELRLRAFSRIDERVVAGVMASGSILSSTIAGLPEAAARS
jgi:Fe-S-cluster containining protein